MTKALLEHAEAYQVDAPDRLMRVDRGGALTESYTYDPAGNRLTPLEHGDWSYHTRQGASIAACGHGTFGSLLGVVIKVKSRRPKCRTHPDIGTSTGVCSAV